MRNGKPNGIMGVPANYKPAAAPLIPWGATTAPNMPAGTESLRLLGYQQRLDPAQQRHRPADHLQRQPASMAQPVSSRRRISGVLDASLFKFTNITEKVTLRFNMDFFNVLNNPNDPITVDSLGILTTRNSGSASRVMQITARLIW